MLRNPMATTFLSFTPQLNLTIGHVEKFIGHYSKTYHHRQIILTVLLQDDFHLFWVEFSMTKFLASLLQTASL